MMVLKDITHIRYQRLFFSVNDFFLTDKITNDAAILYCIQSPTNVEKALKPFYTPLIDLSLSEESIREGIYHRTVSEINSFLSNQTFEHKILTELSQPELKAFIHLFNTFAAQKNIRKAESARLNAYNRQGILAVSFIKQRNAFICVNFYRLTKQRACNLHSFIVQTENPADSASHLGRVHRALHWLDLLEFKKAGVHYYDFCGWYEGTTDKQLLNINQFKEQFTKNIVKEYSGVIYRNKLLLALQKLRK